MRAEQQLAARRFVVADDDGLAASEIQPRDGVLVCHAARETQGVDDGFVVGGIAPETRSAERGTEDRAVNGDDAAIAGGGIVAQGHLFVPHAGDGVEDLHD